MKKRIYRKKSCIRFRFQWIICSMIFIFLFVCGLSICPSVRAEGAEEPPREVVSYESVLICRGDSLWSIAEANIENPTNAKIRAYVDEIISLNNITSTCIHTGNYILIPKYR